MCLFLPFFDRSVRNPTDLLRRSRFRTRKNILGKQTFHSGHPVRCRKFLYQFTKVRGANCFKRTSKPQTICSILSQKVCSPDRIYLCYATALT